MLDLMIDSILDCLKLLPFLFLSYLLVEYIEHRMNEKTRRMIYHAGRLGPVFGGFLGMIPQCGFAAAAAGLYAGGIVTPGTLLAVFLSASDEMLPLFLSFGASLDRIGKILILKALTGMAAGLLLDTAVERWGLGLKRQLEVHDFCEHDHCHCNEAGGVWKGAIHHTLEVLLFLWVISFFLGWFMQSFEIDSISGALGGIPAAETLLCGLLGMIPNCAASVLITQLYLSGMIRSASLFAGLLCGAGAGLLVFFRMDQETLRSKCIFTGILYGTGVLGGLLLGMLPGF